MIGFSIDQSCWDVESVPLPRVSILLYALREGTLVKWRPPADESCAAQKRPPPLCLALADEQGGRESGTLGEGEYAVDDSGRLCNVRS